ncbi:MAG: Fe-S cluster assembly protein SufD, partial [Pseudomonadota bacterium]
MSVVTSGSGYLESLLHGQPLPPASSLAWLNRLRADAVDRVGALTVPTTRDEEWRFTDISPLARLTFQPVRRAPSLETADIAHFCFEEAPNRLVFVDGVHAPELSCAAGDGGLVIANLAVASSHAAAIQQHLGHHAKFD